MGADAYEMSSDNGLVGGMVLMLGILAMMLYWNRKSMLSQLTNFFMSKRTYAVEDMEEGWVTAVKVFLLTCVSMLSIITLCLHGMMEEQQWQDPEKMIYELYGLGFLASMVFIYAKVGVYQLVNWTFFDPESSSVWMKGYLFMTAMTAFLFYPLAMLDVFSGLRHELFTACAILVVILYESLLFYKLTINFRAKKYGYVFIILYFCSVELLPTLVFGHLAIGFNNKLLETNVLF